MTALVRTTLSGWRLGDEFRDIFHLPKPRLAERQKALFEMIDAAATHPYAFKEKASAREYKIADILLKAHELKVKGTRS